MNTYSRLTNLSDTALLAEVTRLAACERQATTQLIASLMEVEARRLHLGAGYSSLFTYCTQALHLSEHAAYRRIEAARAARRFSIILELLESGALHLTAVILLAPLQGAVHDFKGNSRKVAPRSGPSQTHVPNGDPAAVFDKALTVLLADLERTKLGAAKRGRSAPTKTNTSRHIPAAIKRAVWKRDGGQCTFVGTHGRCNETGFLEFHHVVPYADGGQTVVENIELRCRAHNAYEAEKYFGPLWVRETQAVDSLRSEWLGC